MLRSRMHLMLTGACSLSQHAQARGGLLPALAVALKHSSMARSAFMMICAADAAQVEENLLQFALGVAIAAFWLGVQFNYGSGVR